MQQPSDILLQKNNTTLSSLCFKQANIGSTQTGYVFDIPNAKENRSYVRLTRYFLFADGTGVIVKSMPDLNASSKKLTQKSSFKAFQPSGKNFVAVICDRFW